MIREVIGRVEDVVYGPDGRRMVRFHGVFIDQPNVIRGQIVQQALDRIVVRVEPTLEFGDADRQSLAQRVRQRLGNTVHVEVRTTDRFEQSASGKLRSVVSHLSAEEIHRVAASSESTIRAADQ